MTAAVLTEDDYVFLPEGQAAAPSTGTYFQRYADCWWAVHPEKGLVFYNPVDPRTGRRRHSYLGAPQCNADERISRMVSQHCPFPVEIRQVPLAWVPISISDYDH
jgi:hypothetical protein